MVLQVNDKNMMHFADTMRQHGVRTYEIGTVASAKDKGMLYFHDNSFAQSDIKAAYFGKLENKLKGAA